jgi:peptidoglycan hydrolase-like protein with peptidoglycan-binding domain
MHVAGESVPTRFAYHDAPEDFMRIPTLALTLSCFAAASLTGCGSDTSAAPPPPPAPMPVAAAAAPPPTPAAKPMSARQQRIASVQTALNNNGAQLDVDGHMGPKTAAALKAFQQQHSLKATGKLDHATAKALGV